MSEDETDHLTGSLFADGTPVRKLYYCTNFWDESETDADTDYRPCFWESNTDPGKKCPGCGYETVAKADPPFQVTACNATGVVTYTQVGVEYGECLYCGTVVEPHACPPSED